jgi:RHS repeat-associated protein
VAAGVEKALVRTNTGTIVAVYDYDPFGMPMAIGSAGTIATADMAGYTGMRQDSATRLVQLGARLYEPQTGRFTQPDPIGYAGGGNLYAYAGNAPTWRTDRTGLYPDDESESECWLAVGASIWHLAANPCFVTADVL